MTLDELKKLAEAATESLHGHVFVDIPDPAGELLSLIFSEDLIVKLLEMITVLRKGCEYSLTQSESALTYYDSLERSLGTK